MSDHVYRSRWATCDDCELVVIVERDDNRGVPDDDEWEGPQSCPVCDSFLVFGNADEQTQRETALRQGERRAKVYATLYSQYRDVMDNLAQALHDWHGVIGREQFLDAFDGFPEDLIPDALRPDVEGADR